MFDYFQIDDTTWNDLNMDEVYSRLDHCSSSVGKEYLKDSLKKLSLKEDILKDRSARSDFLKENTAVQTKLTKIFKDLGLSKKVSFRDYIFRLTDVKLSSNLIHFLLIILLIAVIVMIFIKPIIGIIGLVIMFIINISTYFAYKGKIEGYFLCIKYLCRMIICAKKTADLKLSGTPFESYTNRLKELYGVFASVNRGSWLITNSVSGSLADVIMDYVRMLFHVDLIKFNTSVKTVIDHSDEVNELFNILGETELSVCICKYRESLESFVTPKFKNSNSLDFSALYHPLIKEPVKNSLNTERSILLTGSNASGKSTFLKCIAINQIFAQTIYTCLADRYDTGFYKVISSMALNDNLLNNESYFVVEIKSLKRIFDEIGNIPIMCFVDEVLRGTNTKERIAASTVILQKLSVSNTLTFAATHDIELTDLLDGFMTNYHFSETVSANSVEFDYLLKSGPSTSRNAIKLLDMYGFGKDIVSEAEILAK